MISKLYAQDLWIEIIQTEEPLPKRVGEKGGVR